MKNTKSSILLPQNSVSAVYYPMIAVTCIRLIVLLTVINRYPPHTMFGIWFLQFEHIPPLAHSYFPERQYLCFSFLLLCRHFQNQT